MGRDRFGMLLAWGGVLLFAAGEARGQASASHRLEEAGLNAGGHPQSGVDPASAGHRLSLGSLGDPFPIQRHFGAAWTLDGGFVVAYPPPGEVLDLLFTSATTLVWDPAPAAGTYSLYRGLISALPGLGYGACAQQGLIAPATTDADLPAPGAGFFYLVTVENRLGEDGTKGVTSSGAPRGGLVCP